MEGSGFWVLDFGFGGTGSFDFEDGVAVEIAILEKGCNFAVFNWNGSVYLDAIGK